MKEAETKLCMCYQMLGDLSVDTMRETKVIEIKLDYTLKNDVLDSIIMEEWKIYVLEVFIYRMLGFPG